MVISIPEMRLQFLPAIADGAFKRFDWALDAYMYLTECKTEWEITQYRSAVHSDVMAFEDKIRCYLSYGAFVNRSIALELLRHRRILIQSGLLSKIAWGDYDR